jgi:hypothetical protein
MDKKSENRISMYKTVIGLCDANMTIINEIPAFGGALLQFKGKVSVIDATAELQTLDIRGHARDKEAARATLEATAVALAGAMASFAEANGNLTLEAEVDFTASELMLARDEELVYHCENLEGKINRHIAELTPYGITELVMDGYGDLIEAYKARTYDPTLARTQKKAYTRLLKEQTRDANRFLKRNMDPLAKMFDAHHHEFYLQYRNARVIYDLKGRGKDEEGVTALYGKVFDAINQEPLKGVHLWIQGTNIATDSDGDGMYEIILEAGGSYVVQGQKIGYVTYTSAEVEVETGKRAELDAGMLRG